MKSKNTLHVNNIPTIGGTSGSEEARILHVCASSQKEPTEITNLEDSRSLVKGLTSLYCTSLASNWSDDEY
jgi:hypothetical protein